MMFLLKAWIVAGQIDTEQWTDTLAEAQRKYLRYVEAKYQLVKIYKQEENGNLVLLISSACSL